MDNVDELIDLITPKNTEWLETMESVEVFASIVAKDIPQKEKNKLWAVELEKHGIERTPLQRLNIVEESLYD